MANTWAVTQIGHPIDLRAVLESGRDITRNGFT